MIRQRLFGTAAAMLFIAASQAQTAPLRLSATLKPNPPIMGENTLDLLITDAAAAPVTGLKISSSVFMTNMNMGTAHPPVKEIGKGHYKVTANFLMEGPWRVTLKGGALNRSLDFHPGDKKMWKAPAESATTATAPSNSTGTVPKPSTPPTTAPTTPPATQPKVEAKPTEVVAPPVVAKQETNPAGGMEDMKGMEPMPGMNHGALRMPQLKASGTVTAGEYRDWSTSVGFGNNEPMVGMMIWMMVGGSGMEGMKMGAMKMDFSEANFRPSEGGDQDMKDMPGMSMPDAAGLKATAKLAGSPKSGSNKVEFTVVDAAGKPVEKAKITLSVAMTNMDMGTTHPAVKEVGKGKYSATVSFSMAGPWRVNAKIEAGGKVRTFNFDYEAK